MTATFDSSTMDDFRDVGPAVGSSAHGQRADGYLAKAYPFHSRSAWKALCKRQHLLCNGRPIRGSHRLRSGDQLAVFHPLSEEPEVDTAIALLAESHGVIAVYKPGNLPMHESGHYRRHTFSALVASSFGPEWAPVHRLDRETSGVVICAATAELRRRISQDFEARRVEKRYLAIVDGRVDWDEQVVEQALSERNDGLRPRYVVDPLGAPAWTGFHVVERTARASLLEARPRTGKPNQIRVHAAWTGHPLIGDKVYHRDPQVFAHYHRHGDTALVRELAGFRRHALHAAEIAFWHPETKRRFHAAVELPSDLGALWQSLQAGATAGKDDASVATMMTTAEANGRPCSLSAQLGEAPKNSPEA